MVTIKNMPKSKSKTNKSDAQLKKDAEKTIRRRGLVNIALAAAALIVVFFGAALIYLNTADIKMDENTPAAFRKIVEMNNRFFPKESAGIAAIVNGEEISFKELDERYMLIPAEYQQFILKEDVLLQMIDEKLLLQAAAKQNITASSEEIDEMVAMLLEQNQISEEEFLQAISSKNLSMDNVKEFYSKEIVLTKLMNLALLPNITVSDTDIQDYYYRHPEEFSIPESINVSHILICHNDSQRCESNLTKEQALERSVEVRAMINMTNFAEIAFNYSYEPAAAITMGNLGWVSRESPFDATFMDAAFLLEPGNVSAPVETVFGYHLITVLEKREEGAINLTAVYDQINMSLSQEQEKTLLEGYLSGLRNESVIADFVNKDE